jgi:sugar lactone lactonase YvrE
MGIVKSLGFAAWVLAAFALAFLIGWTLWSMKSDSAPVSSSSLLPEIKTTVATHRKHAPKPANLALDVATSAERTAVLAAIPPVGFSQSSIASLSLNSPGHAALPKAKVFSPLEVALHPSNVMVDAQLALYQVGRELTATQTAELAAYNEAVRLEDARQFVMSMCSDPQGNFWVGTEGGGIQRFDPSAPKFHEWAQFTTKDGLGDDYGYAIACDHQGRIWVGHLNHGVSVFNGQKWQNYDVVAGIGRADSFAGPLGERVFNIKACPTDGDVWMATSAGLARYSESKDTWAYYTRADGLPSDQVNSIAFDKKGNIYIATECYGIAMARSDDDYAVWRQVTGADRLPTEPYGAGLPTNLINDVLVTDDGIVVAATTCGLAWSNDEGETWRYQRGIEWAGKFTHAVDRPPAGWKKRPGAILAEDYVTRLSKDASGHLYVGYRYQGWGQLTFRDHGGTLAVIRRASSKFYATAFPESVDQYAIAGTYGDGVIQFQSVGLHPDRTAVTMFSKPPALPSQAQPPNLAQFEDELRKMATVPPSENPNDPYVLPLDDDWRTEGAWLGRYGKYWCLLAAMDDPHAGYVWGAGPENLAHSVGLGNHRPDNNFLRFWIAQNFFTDDYRALEIPPVYMHSRVIHGLTTWNKDRRLAEWDDHGESYTSVSEGPGIDVRLSVPEGTFFMSLYEVNDDAHSADRRDPRRDFKVVVSNESGNNRTGNVPSKPSSNDSPMAYARVVNFWGGVYKRFLVRGPVNLKISLKREYSFNTIFNAVMVDLPDERPVGYFQTVDEWERAKTASAMKAQTLLAEWQVNPSERAIQFSAYQSEADAARGLLEKIDEFRTWNPQWYAMNGNKLAILLARWYKGHANCGEDLAMDEASAFYLAGLYQAWEDCQSLNHLTTARQIEKSLRWDGVTRDNSGKGYETIREYLVSAPSLTARGG